MIPWLYRRHFRTGYCIGLILFALVLRLALSPELPAKAAAGMRRVLSSRWLFSLALFLETGIKNPDWQEANLSIPPESPAQTLFSEPAETVQPTEPEPVRPTEPEPEPAPTRFSTAEAAGIEIRGNCTYHADVTELLLAPLNWTRGEGPQVLIIHTHSCESYTQSDGHTYIPDGNFRTLDKTASVIAVGDRLAEELAARGVEVIHDRTYNDYPSYNRSYAVAREKIQEYLEQYPSIVLVIDLHRDALAEPVREATNLNGTDCAKLMLVVGTDEGGLNHPHWQRNLSCALKLQALANREVPELFRPLSFRKERFNGDLSPGEMIVEVGSTGNTLPEALASMPWLAELLTELLRVE